MTDSLLDSSYLQHIDDFDVTQKAVRTLLCVMDPVLWHDQVQGLLQDLDPHLRCRYYSSLGQAIAALDRQVFNNFDCVLLGAEVVTPFMEFCQDEGLVLPVIALVADEEDDRLDDFLRWGIGDYLDCSHLSVGKLRRSLFQVARLQHLHHHNQHLRHKLQRLDERYRLTLEGSKDGIWDWAIAQPEIEGNPRLWEMLGLAPEEPLTIHSLKERIHPQDYLATKTAFYDHLNHHKDFSVEVRLRYGDGEYRDFWVRGKVQRANQKQPRMGGLITDITERQRSDRRNRFLSQASSLLNASLDAKATLENLAWLAVPRIADWCILEIYLDQVGDRPMVISHGNPAKENLVQRFQAQLTHGGNPSQSLQFSYGLSPQERQNFIATHGLDPDLVEQLGLNAYVWMPLRVGDRHLGSILFAWGESDRTCTEADLSLIQELGYRATWSIENARLYDERQAVYDDLQTVIAKLTTQQKRLETLQHLTTLINRRLTNIPELLEGLVHQICKHVPAAQVCAIALYDPKREGEFFVVTDGLNQQAIALGELLQQETHWLQQVYQKGEPHLRNFDTQAPTPCSMAAVAIESVSSGRLGVLVIGNWQIAQAFNLEDCRFLSAVGEEAAIAIDNARLIKTLEQQNQELIETSRVKDLFLATISHELRTPMNAILGFSQVLLNQRRTHLGQREQLILQRILSNGRSLMALINDILDFSQMKLAKLQLFPSTFDLEDLTQNILAELQSLAEEKELRLEFINELANPLITHDQKRLRQVLVNLIANALGFTQEGIVQITLRGEPDQVMIEVQDTGIGIAPEHLNHIFEEFWQVRQDLHRTTSGTGLGLAITQALVRRMQGAIAVDSQVGQGSKFVVTLPRNFSLALAQSGTL